MENEEITEESGIDPTPSPETFSFFDVLSEKAYPKDIVTVYMDDAAAYDLKKLSIEADGVEETDVEKIAEIGARLRALRERIEASAVTFYLTGVGADRQGDAMTHAQEHFEGKKVNRKRADGSITRELPQSEQFNFMKYMSAVSNALHIEKIVLADGRQMVAPSPDEVSAFLAKAPRSAIEQFNAAIAKLEVDTADFERTIDEGFLAKS